MKGWASFTLWPSSFVRYKRRWRLGTSMTPIVCCWSLPSWVRPSSLRTNKQGWMANGLMHIVSFQPMQASGVVFHFMHCLSGPTHYTQTILLQDIAGLRSLSNVHSVWAFWISTMAAQINQDQGVKHSRGPDPVSLLVHDSFSKHSLSLWQVAIPSKGIWKEQTMAFSSSSKFCTTNYSSKAWKKNQAHCSSAWLTEWSCSQMGISC